MLGLILDGNTHVCTQTLQGCLQSVVSIFEVET